MGRRLLSIVASLALVVCLVPLGAGVQSAGAWEWPDVEVGEGDNVALAVGGTLLIDYDGAVDSYADYATVTVTSGSPLVAWQDAGDYQGRATGLGAGSATVTVNSYSSEYDGDRLVATETFTVTVFTLATNVSASVYLASDPLYSSYLYDNGYPVNDYEGVKKTVAVAGLPADASLEVVSDSNANGWSWIETHAEGSITLGAYGAGKHVISIETPYGTVITVTLNVSTVSFKAITSIKRTGSVVTKPKKKTALALTVNGKKKAGVTWKSTNAKVAKVSSAGKVTAKKKGRCYVKATYGGTTLKVLVEVTSAKAYKAVQYAWKDYASKIAYSQAKRNSKGYRDCSSFVRRCYYSNAPKRRVFAFGDTSWPLNAAGQATWLNARGKCVAKKAVSASKLRPGDTVYYDVPGYSSGAGWRGIDHADIYVGNGLCLGTSSYRTDGKSHEKYAISYSYYSCTATCVKFIGRPCP